MFVVIFISRSKTEDLSGKKNRLLKAAPPWHWKPFFEKKEKECFLRITWIVVTIHNIRINLNISQGINSTIFLLVQTYFKSSICKGCVYLLPSAKEHELTAFVKITVNEQKHTPIKIIIIISMGK